MKINYSINISLFALVSVLMLCFKLSYAQQIPQFTQYILNPLSSILPMQVLQAILILKQVTANSGWA